MPPHSFMEWVIGQNVIPRPREHNRRRSVFAMELETDDVAESDTIKVTYPRTGRSSSRRTTQPEAKKVIRFVEDGHKTEVKKTEVQAKPVTKPVPKALPKPLPKPDTDASPVMNTSGDQEKTEEEVIMDCPCANCIEAQRKLKKAKEAESLSNAAAVHAKHVHAKHKAKVAKKTEPAKHKSSTKKQKPKQKAKKRKVKFVSEAETTEATATESETEVDAETETEVETEEDTEAETESESGEEEVAPKKKKGGKEGRDNKKPGKSVKKSRQDKKSGESKKGGKASAKSQKQESKGNKKSKKETSTIDDELVFKMAMSYNREKQKEREERMKVKAEEEAKEEKAKEEKAKEEKAKEEKAKAKAKAKARARAKAKAEAEAEKSLPPHNPGLEKKSVRFLQPSQSQVLHVEHSVEEPSDPYPNAFYDNRNGIMRVYHGPSYGNPTSMLYPQKTYENQPLPVGTPHPLENPYYNGFQSTANRGRASAFTPPQTPPRQRSPLGAPPDPPQAEQWFQGVGSVQVGEVPVGTDPARKDRVGKDRVGKDRVGKDSARKDPARKGSSYEESIDTDFYDREIRQVDSPTSRSAKAARTSKNSDRAGRSNVVPPTKANDKKSSDTQSIHGSQKGSRSRDGSQNGGGKGGTRKEKEPSVIGSLWKITENEDEEMGWSQRPDNVNNPHTNDNHSHRSGSNNNDQSEGWGGEDVPLQGSPIDWEHARNIPTDRRSNTSVKNGSSSSRKSSNSSKASSARSRTNQTLPGGWVSSPTKSDRSTRSRPPGTIPDNVGPDLTSSTKKSEGKRNNNVDEKADEWGDGGKRNGRKNKNGPSWKDTDVAQTSGGVFEDEDNSNGNNNEGEWNGEGGQKVKGQSIW